MKWSKQVIDGSDRGSKLRRARGQSLSPPPIPVLGHYEGLCSDQAHVSLPNGETGWRGLSSLMLGSLTMYPFYDWGENLPAGFQREGKM